MAALDHRPVCCSGKAGGALLNTNSAFPKLGDHRMVWDGKEC